MAATIPDTGAPSRTEVQSLFGRDGKRLVGYDNERGKGDHKHIGKAESLYAFVDVDTLVADFIADVRRLRDEIN